MRKIIKSLVLILIIGTMYVLPTFAMENTSDSASELLIGRDESVTYEISPRGMYISTAFLTITNPGDGGIGFEMMTVTHQNVDKTEFNIIVERWIPSEERWANVGSADRSFTQEDVTDGDLTTMSISGTVYGQPSDCYYRLRGFHKITINGISENLRTTTDGILITKN